MRSRDRTLRIIATPGHETAEVSIYDPHTHILFTGDIFYPSRLYVGNWDAFVGSIERVIAFCETYPITHLLGCHVEMSIYPKLDYLIRSSLSALRMPLVPTQFV